MKCAPFNLILLGDPASGKGTQAEHIVKKYHLYDLDMGREVRKPAAKRHYDYRRTTAIGKLTPTAVVRGIFRHVIATVPPSRGILFNGNPKMIGEAQFVARLLAKHKRRDPLVIYLSIPMSEVIRRTKERKIYVNGKLVKRDDDTLRALQNRRRYYKEQVSHTLKFFRKQYGVKTVSGMGNEKQVWKRIDAVVNKYLMNS